MAPLVIRRVAPDDRSEWLRMRTLVFHPADHSDLAAELDSMMEDSTTPVFVAERQGGGLCGLLEAGTRPYADGCDTSPVGYIEGWFVDEDVRGTGVGRALVAAAEAMAGVSGRRSCPTGYGERSRSMSTPRSWRGRSPSRCATTLDSRFTL